MDALRAGQPFETSPGTNLATLTLVDDDYRLAGWPGRAVWPGHA